MRLAPGRSTAISIMRRSGGSGSVRSRSAGHRIAHPASWAEFGGLPVVKVLFQTYGTSLFEQDGRRLVIAPGDCLFYDVSRPHVITSPALTKHHVVIIPRQLMEQRGVPLDQLQAQQVSAREGAGRLAHDLVVSAFSQAPALSPGCELQVAEALLDLVLLPFFSESCLKRSGREALTCRIKTLIHENLSDPELSIEQLSSALDCTKRYLHMSFADESTTITGYIWQERLEKCLRRTRVRPEIREDRHRYRFLLGIQQLVAFHSSLQEAVRDSAFGRSKAGQPSECGFRPRPNYR